MAATCTAAWTRAPRQEQAAEIPIVLFPSVVFPGATEILQLAKDDEIKLGGRWKSLDTSAASKIQEVNWRVSQYNVKRCRH
uniref:Uncharacterized protein n=1 Tax=Oryza barthii TaxID=65489 RepID=A0A0D3FKW4_9ORYZ